MGKEIKMRKGEEYNSESIKELRQYLGLSLNTNHPFSTIRVAVRKNGCLEIEMAGITEIIVHIFISFFLRKSLLSSGLTGV